MQKVLYLLLGVEREVAGETSQTTHGLGNGGENWGDLRTELAHNMEGYLLMRESSWKSYLD